jgi:hypothetical protein
MLALLALSCAAVIAVGQSDSNTQLEIGATVGLYMPSSSTIRNAFSDTIFTWGISPVAFGRPPAGKITPSINLIAASENGSSFFLIPVTAGYEYHFGETAGKQTTILPFARIEAGLAYMNFAVNTPGGRADGSEVGLTGDVELGVQISQSVTLSARYYLFQQENGLSFNGLQLGLTFGFLRL